MKQNIGTGEKKIRTTLGAIAILYFFSYDIKNAAAYIILAAGIILLMTGFIGFCPLYSLLGINRNPLAKIDLKKEIEAGNAIIVDVRTPQEYASGHIPGSTNIPLNNISEKKNELTKKYKTIITCCASGMRSASAKKNLSGTEATIINGGSWRSLEKILS